jgi:glycosyltransferase involved in cell wall biosynthesis
MKVSVLVPVFNGADYLAECLDSILMQDFRDVEILIADDQSSDASPAIIEKYAARDARIRWWQNPQRLGLTANSNVCLRAASGEYIKFVHQDDKFLCPSALGKMVAALDENPSAVLAGSRQHLTGKKSPPTIFSRNSGLYNGRQMIVACLEQNTNLIGQPSLTLFRKQFAGRGFDERFTGLMDYEMWCHLLEQGDFIYLAEPLATWRVHTDQQTARCRQADRPDHEALRLLEIYGVKPWLKKSATRRLLFIQTYYLRKKYGSSAENLTRKMMAGLTPSGYVWEWLKHKLSKPFQKLIRKLN